MEAIIPIDAAERQGFYNCAIEVGFDEFVAVKLNYTMLDTDLDIFQLMGDERLSLLLYGWERCDSYVTKLQEKHVSTLPQSLCTVVKCLTQYSLDVWFSKEWDKCRVHLKMTLIFCLNRAKEMFAKIPGLSLLNWDYLIRLDLKPWRVSYLNKFFNETPKPKELTAQSIETVEQQASDEDVAYLQHEGLFVVLLRLIKMFDAGSMEGVKNMSMRVIAAWNRVYERMKQSAETAFPQVTEEHKSCLVHICHIYLMVIYETDDVHGFIIDNMINNLRFYYQSIEAEGEHEDFSIEHLEYTPARFIAITCINLRMSCNDFFDAFIYETYVDNFPSLFSAVSQSYLSYILGNLLMGLNNMNEQDFDANLEKFKRLMIIYVKERERSESFMLREIRKQEQQRFSHNSTNCIKNMTDFKSKLCKGNRMSNIGNYEKIIEVEEDEEEETCEQEEDEEEVEQKDHRIDPVFQNIPNNSVILNYVYNVLAKRSYKGWHFAKVVLLLKIIGLELNIIETWRYHPGLTTEFMLNLEVKLSHHFEGLAKIFVEHPFMEQEFWLTAFYLNPCNKYYEAIIRCGMRYNRSRQKIDFNDENIKPEHSDRFDKTAPTNVGNAKFGLLSSTIDVQAIVGMANHEAPQVDYEPLFNALQSFRLPENIIKDLLTVTFLPRNKGFAWAVEWAELRTRCKHLLKNARQKRRFVELNMAEANDRLKYLKIDYAKYKNRPQLDYGSIEEGYENVANFAEHAHVSDDDDDDDGDFSADYEEYKDESPVKKEKVNEVKSEDELFDSYFAGTRRTRARTAAVIATAMFDTRKRRIKKEEDSSGDASDKSASITEPKSPVGKSAAATKSTTVNDAAPPKKDLKELLKERSSYDNATSGFKPFPDIWDFEAKELQCVAANSIVHLETENLLQKFSKLTHFKQTYAVFDTQAKAVGTTAVQIEQAMEAKALPLVTRSSTEQETETASEGAEFAEECNDMEVLRELQEAEEAFEAAAATALIAEKTDAVEQMELSETDSSKTNTSTMAVNDSQSDREFSERSDFPPKFTDEKSSTKIVTTCNDSANQPALLNAAEEEVLHGAITKQEEDPVKNEEAISQAITSNEETIIGENLTEPNQLTSISQECDVLHEVPSAQEKESLPASTANHNTTNNSSSENAELKEIMPAEKAASTELSAAEETPDPTNSDNTQDLIKSCAERDVRIVLHRLAVSDLSKLRQPKVRIKRMNIEAYMEETAKQRRSESAAFVDSDDTSKSSSGSLFSSNSRDASKNLRPSLLRAKLQRRTSDSSTASDDFKYKRRPSRGRGGLIMSAARRQERAKNLIVTPRSASGLKLRISSLTTDNEVNSTPSTSTAKTLTKRAPVIDFIQISSSSSDMEEIASYTSTPYLSPVMDKMEAMKGDPLYEEEIVPISKI